MRVAALYDIHGNLPALEAALSDAKDCGVDLIVVGGDIVPGPLVRESLDYLLQFGLPTRFLRGNGETAVLDELAGRELVAAPEQAAATIRWSADELTESQQALLATWPDSQRMEIPGLGDTLFCHATPRSETEIFTRFTAEEKLLPLFTNAGVNAVVCGHTHMPFDRRIGDVRVVNAGSVGMPFGARGAHWALLGPGVEARIALFDLEEAARRIRACGYPGADAFAERHILNPPTEEEILAVYSRAELKA